MDPFEKVVRQLVDNIESRIKEAVTQGDLRREEILMDVLKDLQNITHTVLKDHC